VHHAHLRGVVHRDLKPANVLVTEAGQVKVIDFGVARSTDSDMAVTTLQTDVGQLVGTLQYMSPEQIDAQTVDQRSDLYCLGLVFYELLAGRPPFHSSSPRQLLNMQCTEKPPKLDEEVRAGLSKGIQRLVFQLLEKEPDARPQSAAEVVERLEEFLPDRSFASLADPDAERLEVAPASDRAGEGSSNDTLPSAGSGAGAAGARSRDDEEPSTHKRETGKPASKAKRAMARKEGGARKDTVALIDEAASQRELSTGLSLVIIVVLMVLAGVGTYLWRASQSSDTGSPSTDAPATADGESAAD
jgi:serine/threonine protein kinase